MKDRWTYLYKLDIEDLENRACRVKVLYDKGWAYGQLEIDPLLIKEIGREKAIIEAIYQICGNHTGLRQEALESLKESYRIYENQED